MSTSKYDHVGAAGGYGTFLFICAAILAIFALGYFAGRRSRSDVDGCLVIRFEDVGGITRVKSVENHTKAKNVDVNGVNYR